MSDFTHIAWTDLETTGLSPAHHELLEVGVVLTDLDLNVISEHSWLVQPDKLDFLRIDPVVLDMHTKNGLLHEIIDRSGKSITGQADLWDAKAVDRKIGDWLRSSIDNWDWDWQIALGGSGVSHFDIRWITQYLPDFARLLYRSTVDVGVIRRFVENVVQRPWLVPEKPRELTHRALDDARNHLAEARIYQEMLRELAADESRQS